jgi:hypothetical protein
VTLNEAVDRVNQLWCGRMITVRLRPDGGADVNLQAAHRRGGPVLASDTRDRHNVYHRLDAHGHVICHRDCQEMEAGR